jgi:hypothetical protein
MSKIFLQRGSSFSLAEDNFTVHPKLEKGLYDLRFNMETGISLEKIGESFQFDYKLYNLDNKFIDHVVNSYKNAPVKKNMGVLLNGERGTGKTVCAKYLANLLDLPIIAISGECPGLTNFIMSIKQDVIFFFDEFEKNFRRGTNEYDEDQSGESLLSIMDGVYNTGFSHIFILTTNELRINKNFLSRPSRIKYLKTFDSVMSKEVLEEIADDFLNDASKKEELIAFVSTLEFASIDIIKSIIEEMNIHNCGIDEFKRFFNVSISEYTYCYYSTYIYERDGDNYSMEEFFADAKEPYNDDNKRVMYYNSLRCDRPFEALTVGSEFRNDEIVYLDPEKKYIVTYDIPSSRKTFYKVISVYQNKLYK